ncbi:unnamed protein product [Vitrella brassicaformis CCMP3155]|uniref:Uncharacterized protein n=2 Tax=Vitrella brassicaformis TaxID=1169539 RepID=A0A0G4F957_VITBC|nr:unnamed protein product [Vitrella brassicaformis CCMP3155]|eukprot:CEM08762.1 unnamed protein product [Vitrella brassicaformis CCMP3155]
MMDSDDQQQQQQQQAAASQVTHSVDLEAFAQRCSQLPVVVAYVFSFVSLHLVAALPQRLWRHVGCQITQLVMDTYDTAERRFWCGLSFNDALEWGRRLKRLSSIVVEYPMCLHVPTVTPAGRLSANDSLTLLPRMSNKVVTALVEGHIQGRRAAAAAAAAATRQPAGSTLNSIDISRKECSITVEKDEYRNIRAATEQSSALPPPLDPPPILQSLESITAIILPPIPGTLVCPGRGRHWQLPSLETVHVPGTVHCNVVLADILGELVGTSRCLKDLHVECTPVAMRRTLRHIPTAAAGQPGPLAQLEYIGTLRMPNAWAAGLEDLQDVLVDRGCRSIKKLDIDFGTAGIDSRIFETLLTIEAFTNAKHIKQLAAHTRWASFTIHPHHLTTPLDTPSSAVIDLAERLTFPNAQYVSVVNHPRHIAPHEQPDPVVLDRMPDDAFPAASLLTVDSNKGHAAGRRLVAKMPAVGTIKLTNPTEEQAVGVLQAVGGERGLGWLLATSVKGVGEGGLTCGDIADQLPTIKRLDLTVEVPEALRDEDAVGEFGIACVKSLLKIRGVEELTFELRFAPLCRPGRHYFKRVVEQTHRNTIGGIDGREYDISWGRDEKLILKQRDT